MAKISELPSASALDGTETIPVVQGGTTKQTSITDINVPIVMKVELASDQALPAAAWTTITTWDTPEFDTGSGWNAGLSRFQPSIAGYYNVTFTGSCNPGGADETVQLGITYNGSLSHLAQSHRSTSGYQYFTTSTIFYFNGSSDYVYFRMNPGDTFAGSALSGVYRTEVVTQLIR